MSQINQDELIIMKNVLFLAQSSKKSLQSQRNLLNKWFQDSIKSYFMESLASSLIANHLNLQSTQSVKAFIHKQIDQNKPKYMGIIDQYFNYIKKYNQQYSFTTKLQQILLEPIDITNLSEGHSQNCMKKARKQFVSILILKYFNLYGQQEMSSFYDLWNICFPQVVQEKKKLSKYDNQSKSKRSQANLKQKLAENESLKTKQKSTSLQIEQQQQQTIQQENLQTQFQVNLQTEQVATENYFDQIQTKIDLEKQYQQTNIQEQ
ncbi:hypothetical protein TTHERM_02477160, partial (macronuclear) [Tetrahymena thermophila SB210]